MRRLRWPLVAALLGLILAVLTSTPRADSQDIVQYGFEGRDPVWAQGESRASFRETVHAITADFAHGGQRSEHIQLAIQQGEFIHYTYNVGHANVTDELIANIWVRANRPGVQLLARVVLPRERDPNNPAQPLTVLLRGDTYQNTSRWQPLGLHQPIKRLNEQIALLRAELKRPDVNFADAYVDRLVLNLYCGPGQLDVYLDDLEVGPVLDPRQAGPAPPPVAARTPGGQPATNRRAGLVKLDGTPQRLFVGDGQKFFPRGIRHTGTPLKTLYDAGFNTLWLDESAPPGLVDDAVNHGFYVVPSMTPPAPARTGDAVLTANEVLGRRITRYLPAFDSNLLAWNLGDDQQQEQAPNSLRLARALRTVDPTRPVVVDVSSGFQRFANGFEHQVLVGAHRFPLSTGIELTDYLDWLIQRRLLAGLDTFCWTWIQTHAPDWFTTIAYDRTAAGTFTEPVGPEPEQIRLLTYLAVGAGYRGVAYWSDRFLADTHTGRDRLLTLAMLNQELKMLEPILVDAAEPEWITTSSPDVKAAVLRMRHSPTLLVLPIWVGKGSQCVPGQGAVASLKITVPAVPMGCQCWEVSPADVHSLKWERKIGGNEITVHEFCLTAAIVFTSDLSGLIVKFQKDQREMAASAAQWAYDEAREELAKVERVHRELEALGQKLQDGDALLDRSRAYLESSLSHRRAGEHSEGYAEAQRALRPLRILMRVHWERAVKPLRGLADPEELKDTTALTPDTPDDKTGTKPSDSRVGVRDIRGPAAEATKPIAKPFNGVAVASPYAVSFYTLPRQWRFWEQISRLKVAANVLSDGDFELPLDRVPEGWLVQEATSLDNVVGVAKRVKEEPHEGKQCLKLEVKPRDPLTAAAILERTCLAIHSPTVRLPAGTIVRISAWIRIGGVTGSPDGVMFYDSAGGEPLAVRLTSVPFWKKITLYRTVPADGTISVTMALTGMGSAYFDDVCIEPLVPAGTTITTAAAGAAH